MKIYIDLIILLNLFFDLIILLGVNYILKLNTKLFRLFLGSLLGGLSILTLFLRINQFQLFILKIIISILIILITFGSENFLKKTIYFYIISIFLGGTIQMINNLLIKNKGLVFIKSELNINFIVIIILTPVIVYLYVKEKNKYKLEYTNKYKICIYYKGQKYNLCGYLDTGNTLKDPYKKRDVIILNNNTKIKLEKTIYVPYKTISTTGVIKCSKPEKVIINNKEIKNCLIGRSNEKFLNNDSDCILPNKFKEIL